MSARQHLVRIAGFGIVPMLSLFASVVLLPLISHNYGPLGWTALSVGQSTGAVMSIAVGLAWPIFGGNSVAAATSRVQKQAIYRLSVDSRLVILAVLGPIGAVWAVLTTPGYQVEAALFSIALALNGLSAAWYFAGAGTPGPLIRNEAVVRLVAYASAAFTIHVGLGLMSYAVILLAAAVLSVLLNQWTVMRGAERRSKGAVRAARREAIRQVPGVIAVLAQGAIFFGGPTVFALVAPSALVVYAAAYQMQRSAYSGLIALPTSFVSWVGSASGLGRAERTRRSLAVVIGLLLVFGVLWAVLIDPIARYLFGGRLQLSGAEGWALFASIVSLVLAKAVELLVMVPADLVRHVYRGTTVSSIAGIVAIAVGAHLLGVTGGLLGVVVAGVTALLYYTAVLLATPRGPDGSAVQSDPTPRHRAPDDIQPTR